MPGFHGAARQGWLIYLVNDEERVVLLLWIYTHAEFEKRPPEKELAEMLKKSESTES